jgi:4'-phosphopantetheinyl transferase
VARHAFSSRECEALAALAPDARREAFFRIWARKEAYVKARGEGLSYPTRSFSVLHRDGDDALIDDERDEQARDRWRVTGLDAPPGFAAALAAEGRDWTVLRFDATQLPR